MTSKKQNPFTNLKLDEYEQEIEDSLDPGSDIKMSKKQIEFWQKSALKHIAAKASKRINIRINQLDLAKVKAKAEKNNIGYQTLISTLVRQYARGKIRISL